ncbi:hypothetical protein BLNAU_9635 [Blattamonas nauphoetae]|uniref:Uncharacterized protein n=1 Tax=Blattamonas nauphoetae TaxID=2049346 RepID=A0ABQ9XVB9_9EUKA|nr:hypothetical protein BLNAU_9635 [Blattamonas nauphoetae]
MSVAPTAFVLEPHSSDMPESTNRNASCGRHQQILSAPSECVGQSGVAVTRRCPAHHQSHKVFSQPQHFAKSAQVV